MAAPLTSKGGSGTFNSVAIPHITAITTNTRNTNTSSSIFGLK
jgi:hypothetical protein